MDRDAHIEDSLRPAHPFWWIGVIGLLSLLALLGFSASFHRAYSHALYNPGDPTTLKWVFLACIPIHVFEGAWAFRRAKELGMQDSARMWAGMCFLIGFPGSWQLVKLARTRREIYSGAPPVPTVPVS